MAMVMELIKKDGGIYLKNKCTLINIKKVPVLTGTFFLTKIVVGIFYNRF